MPDGDSDFVAAAAAVFQEPAKKKPKRKSAANLVKNTEFAKVKGRLGALEKFNELPLDVLADICSELDHETLLTLTVTSRSFRAFLVSPYANLIWVNARKEAGLPVLRANDITEIQYANLVYNRTCQICRKKNVSKVNFHLRARLCPSCIKTNIVERSGYDWAGFMHDPARPGVKLAQLSLDCSPTSASFRRHRRYQEYFGPAVRALHDEMERKFFSKFDKEARYHFICNGFMVWHEFDVGYVYLPKEPIARGGRPTSNSARGVTALASSNTNTPPDTDWSDLDDEMAPIPSEIYGNRPGLYGSYNSPQGRILLGPQTELQAFVVERKNYVASRRRDAALLVVWTEVQKSSKAMDKDALRLARKAEAEKRLREDGWGNDDFNDYTWKYHRSLSEPKLITDRIWKNLCPVLTEFLETRRAERAEAERLSRLGTRRMALLPVLHRLNALNARSKTWEAPPLRVFLSYASVTPYWRPEGVNIITEDVIKESRAAFEADHLAWSTANKLAFFDGVKVKHAETIKNYPTAKLAELPIAKPIKPTSDEIDAVIQDAVARCHRCHCFLLYDSLAVHVDSCPNFLTPRPTVQRDFDFDPATFCRPNVDYSIDESSIVVLSTFKKVAAEKAASPSDSTSTAALASPSASASASASASDVADFKPSKETFMLYCHMGHPGDWRCRGNHLMTRSQMARHVYSSHPCRDLSPTAIAKWVESLSFSKIAREIPAHLRPMYDDEDLLYSGLYAAMDYGYGYDDSDGFGYPYDSYDSEFDSELEDLLGEAYF